MQIPIWVITILALTMNSTVFAQLLPSISLSAPQFHASGQGDTMTMGAIRKGRTKMIVEDIRKWQQHHGIRVRRGGLTTVLHSADMGWQPSGGSVTVVHDTMQKREGAASVECRMPVGGPASPLGGAPVCWSPPRNKPRDSRG
jgi:hypothetical protein